MYTAIAVVFLVLCGSCAHSEGTIPKHLHECYGNTTEAYRCTTLPLNLRTILAIIRKVEAYTLGTMDLRTLSSSMLHRFRFDGIVPELLEFENTFKYSGNGRQRMKHSLVEDLVPGDLNTFPDDALTVQERCTLHWAVSNTIWDHYNEIDRSFCVPKTSENFGGRSSNVIAKKCPKEGGVILTPYGTVSLGTVIAAISAALQPQLVPINVVLQQRQTIGNSDDDIDDDLLILKDEMLRKSSWFQSISSSGNKLDNVWVATVAGELAEVALNQGSLMTSMTFGASGSWNHTLLPQVFYVSNPYNNFDATKAEIIGGIDGINIAKNLPSWYEKYNNLRMSQVLDMYYSGKGMVFDKEVKACKRVEIFQQIVSTKLLKEKTYATAEALTYRNSIDSMSSETLHRMTSSAVEEFMRYTNEQLFTERKCHEPKVQPRVELIVAFDGTSTRTLFAPFFVTLVEEFDVSMYGSKMGIVHGETGEWIQNVTDSPIEIYRGISNLTNISWPVKMNITAVFHRISRYLDAVWEERRKNHILGGYGQIVAILAPLTKPTEAEKKCALSVLREIKSNHPEVHFMYFVTEDNSDLFKSFSLTDEDVILNKFNIDDIVKIAAKVPMTLRPVVGNIEGSSTPIKLEDYVAPSRPITYRLHPKWRQNTKEFKLIVNKIAYGSIKMYFWDKMTLKSDTLKTYYKNLKENDTEFIDYWDCTEKTCPNAFYKIQTVSTSMQCNEMDCKTPDQVKYTLHFENSSSSSSRIIIRTVLLILQVMAVIKYFSIL